MFHRQFPERRISISALRQVYQQNKIKRRRIIARKYVKGMNAAKQAELKEQMKQEWSEAEENGRRIIYMDETCFTRTTVPKTEYCRQGEEVTIDESKLNEKTLALILGISAEKGVEHWKLYPRSVNGDKYEQYLRELRQRNPFRRLALFQDNLAVHRSNRAKE